MRDWSMVDWERLSDSEKEEAARQMVAESGNRYLRRKQQPAPAGDVVRSPDELRLLELLTEILLSDYPKPIYWGGEWRVDSIDMIGTYPDTAIAIRLDNPWRPGCQFGFAARVWALPSESPPDPLSGASGMGPGSHFAGPDAFAGILAIHLDETIMTEHGMRRLSQEPCGPGQVVWVANDPWTYFSHNVPFLSDATRAESD